MALNERDKSRASGDTDRDARLERLYREAAREVPPAHLDAAILAAARREVGARPRSLSAALRRWHVPVSIAAVVVVSVSLVMLMREEEGRRVEGPPDPAVAKSADSFAAPQILFSMKDVAQETAQPQATAPAPQGRESRDDAAMRQSATGVRSESAASAAPGAEAVATPEPAAKPLPRPSLSAQPRAVDERAAPAAADTATAGRVASAPAAPSELRSARPESDARQASPMARSMAVKAPEQEQVPVWRGFEKEPPAKWLARMEELKRQGRAAEAEEMLSEFKRRFPEHPLPAAAK